MNVALKSKSLMPAGKAQGTVSKAVKSALAWRRSDAVEWVLFWTFVAALAWVPFLYASNLPIAWGINAALFSGLVVIYEVSLLVRGQSHPVGIKVLAVPAALFVAVVLWIVFQNATWTPSVLHHPIWGMTSEALGSPVARSISVNRDLTTLALVRLLTSASVFWIALQLCRNASRVYFFTIAIAFIIAGYAAYGLVLLAMTPGTIHWMGNTLTLGFVTSTFYDRSHFATYAGIGLIAMCGLILRLYGHALSVTDGSLRLKLASVIDATGQRGAALLAAAFLILVAILLTGSRGGLIATGLGLLTLGVLWLGGRNVGMTGKRTILVFATFFVAVVCVAFGNMMFSNLTERGFTDQTRMAADVINLRSIFDAPLLGYGYGAFVDVFPMFRDQSISTEETWEFAHNTYLEVFQGLGLVFGSMLVACVVLLVLKCAKGAINRQDSMTPRVAVSLAILVGVQALVDFSLQMQAVTLTFMALLGAGVAQSESSRLALND
jgi:O-antigen ligase